MLTLPGLIDPHVHLRDPEQTEKEDFYTGTMAALAGGYTTIIDMPNNKTPVMTARALAEKMSIAKDKIVCDVGFYFGTVGNNIDEFEQAKDKTFGLKLYLNQTTGNFLLEQNQLESIFHSWKRLILVHAEGSMLEKVIKMVRLTRQSTHICHVSLQEDLEMIIKAKEEGLPITCGVTPHHLFLTEEDVSKLGAFGKMKPSLSSKKDIAFLWQNLNAIDIVESDHAPHTKTEKESDHPPFGVPGLETTLPLLLTAVTEDRLTQADIIRLCFENPAKLLGIKTDANTKVEVDQDSTYTIHNSNLLTKCGWTPFDGWKVKVRVVRVFLHGEKVYEDGKVFAKPGSGKIITPVSSL